MQKRIFALIAIVILALPLAGVFAQDATEEPTEEVAPIELPVVDPLSVTGDITAAGSSTVYPLSERMVEVFIDEGYSGQYTLDSIGSGAGFERFCVAGETDIANASRAIKDSEIEQCETIGRTPIEFRVGTDAIAVVVSSANDFVTDLSIAQLGQIFSGAATTWADVDPSFPAETIQVFSPGTDSGTFDYFVEAILESEEGAALEGEAAVSAILGINGIQLSEDDNVLVQGVEGSPYAIGYFGFAYYQENSDLLNALAVNSVVPNLESAEDGSYPLARPLFLYSAASIFAEKPQVADFISFYLTNVNDEIVEAGYFPASVEALNDAKQALLEALAG